MVTDRCRTSEAKDWRLELRLRERLPAPYATSEVTQRACALGPARPLGLTQEATLLCQVNMAGRPAGKWGAACLAGIAALNLLYSQQLAPLPVLGLKGQVYGGREGGGSSQPQRRLGPTHFQGPGPAVGKGARGGPHSPGAPDARALSPSPLDLRRSSRAPWDN